MKKKNLLTISLLSLVLSLGCFYAATTYIDALAKEKLFAPVVKVADGKQITPFQPITRADVVLVQEEVDEIQLGAFDSLDNVLGKQSVQPIYAGEQMLSVKLRDGFLLPERDQARYEFPLTMMLPLTELRKGDAVKVWVRYKSQNETETMPAPVHFHKSNVAADLLFTSQLVTVKDSNGMEIYTLKPQVIPETVTKENPFFHGSKAEQFADGEQRYRDYRAQPSAMPAYVGFNLTDKQYVMLSEAIQYGTIQIGHVLVSKEGKVL